MYSASTTMPKTRFRRRFSSWPKKGVRSATGESSRVGLHEVAHRIAGKARVGAIRRRTIERQGLAMSPQAIEQSNQDEAAAWNELRPVLHAEVERLPERYRLPVILSYLEGKTNEEVATLLRWPVGTVKGRLSRARDLLRSRLMRRGMALSAAFLMTALSQGTVFAEVIPAELVRRTVRLAGKIGPRSLAGDPLELQNEGVAEPGARDVKRFADRAGTGVDAVHAAKRRPDRARRRVVFDRHGNRARDPRPGWILGGSGRSLFRHQSWCIRRCSLPLNGSNKNSPGIGLTRLAPGKVGPLGLLFSAGFRAKVGFPCAWRLRVRRPFSERSGAGRARPGELRRTAS